MIAKGLRSIFLDLILCASHSSTFSKFNGYFVSLEIYKHLGHHDIIGNVLRHQTLHLLCGARFAKAISNSRKQLIDMRENLLVTMDLVKIADFGLAREVHSKPPFT
ncbi:hypothetical protein ZIOFF_043552 [Zingiber officinale]|uniref:Protein kinase domain-containing protein n=1 Tax=Zingiber officinale TaxID=94328 RepID=A0A8J5FWS7_ZINOF|nr:hypothetical protein ZIOFF_043552 [Zingiber officinale]